MNKVTKAVIPAAGFGTRFLPFTKAMPKEMLPIVDIPAIEYIVREAYDSGITQFLIIINEEKECIKTHFGRNEGLERFLTEKHKSEELRQIRDFYSEIHISYVYQKKQLGLGHAVLCAKSFVGNEPFALLLGDDVYVGKEEPATLQLLKAYEQTGCLVLGTLEVPDCDVSKYGICEPALITDTRLVKLKSVIEKPSLEDAPSHLAIGGRYVLTPAIFGFLETQTRGAGGEIQLTDSILRLMSVEDVYSLAIDGRRYDLGSKKGFLEATVDFALARPDLHEAMLEIINRRK